MNAVGISPNASTIGTVTPTSVGFADLKPEDFFGLLIAELQSQDPLNPADNQQLLDQMASIRQMEQSTTLNATLQALASEQRFGATAGLIGQYVAGRVTNEAGDSFDVRGVVTGVQFNSKGEALLELHNGFVFPADKVEFVTLVENLPDELLEELNLDLNPSPGSGVAAPPAGSAEETAARRVAAAARQRHGDAPAWMRAAGNRANDAANFVERLIAPIL